MSNPPLALADDFVEKYALGCVTEQDQFTFAHQEQPWLEPDQQHSLDEYNLRIADIESQQGVYTVTLIPELVGLGHGYREAEEHGKAVAAYQRALDIVKVNEGLYSANQIPLIEILIEQNSKVGNWKRVANYYDYMHWLYRRNYSDDDIRLLSALKRIRTWQVESYSKPTGRPLQEQFKTARLIYDQVIEMIAECSGDRELGYCFWHEGCCPDSSEESFCPVHHPRTSASFDNLWLYDY